MNGKGDKLRKGANLKKFRDNFDSINWSKTISLSAISPSPQENECKPPHKPQVDP